ncbi:hypothetical protein [Microbacterium foliorum]|uniref:hypothetical protein n=1 Tax=Microbacterium foliorum TaxID=104336 RepID=UPI00099FCF20|nr:hypothetical protein [Microbacterium foliorum]AQY02032.1 hypothetical protein B2G67_11545 [Microbacterium foliorum]
MAFTYTGEQVDLGFGRGWLNRPAAASIRRIDRQIGHPLQITEAGRTWGRQNEHWLTYRRVGRPIALHPDTPSEHQKGNSIDSDEAQRIIAILEDHGWRRTVYRWVNGRWTLVEPWHFEYFAHLDNHRNDPAGTPAPQVPKEDDDMLMLNLHGIGTATHKVALGPGVFRHFIGTDPYEKIKNLARIQDDWQDVSYNELPALLRTYGCDLNIWDWNPSAGGFCILDPLTGTVKPGNAWTASGATRAAIAGIKMPAIDPAPIVAAVEKALEAGIQLDEKAIAKAVNDDAANRMRS